MTDEKCDSIKDEWSQAFEQMVKIIHELPIREDAKAKASREVGKIILSARFGGEPVYDPPKIPRSHIPDLPSGIPSFLQPRQHPPYGWDVTC